MPIYIVTSPDAPDRLVEAPNKQAALIYAVQDKYKIEAISASALVPLMRSGVEIETVGTKVELHTVAGEQDHEELSVGSFAHED
jgi:hypothetical protein